MFIPIRCPNTDCRAHRDPAPGFFVREGFYHPLCRSHAVPRFRCRVCRRGFSRQTFRADRRQKKPSINAFCLDLMVACVGMRQAARVLGVARRTVERRFAWLARHAADFQANRLAAACLTGPFQLDELESFEANRYQPVTVPVLIERRSLFIVATAVGPLRRKGRLSPQQRLRRAATGATRCSPSITRTPGCGTSWHACGGAPGASPRRGGACRRTCASRRCGRTSAGESRTGRERPRRRPWA